MPAVSYVVTAALPDVATRDEYARWLLDGHVQAVLAGGANRAEVIGIEDPATPLAVQSRYEFPDRAAFDRYIAEVAPRLRAEGVARFGSRPGVSFARLVGTILGP